MEPDFADESSVFRRDTTGSAKALADAAARMSGVTIRNLADTDDLQAAHQLYQRIWQSSNNSSPVTAELLRAMAAGGCYVGGAFDSTELIGASFGFFGPPVEKSLHSHIAGVSARMRGRKVGFALKVHQRAWAMSRGVDRITWTFDPLIRRNAYFNIVKLAAEPVTYHPDFYGRVGSEGKPSGDTDRLLVHWQLTRPEVIEACSGRPKLIEAAAARASGAAVGLDVTSTGWPVPGRTNSGIVLVAVPPDIEELRRRNPVCAEEWQAAMREVLGSLLADGAWIKGFDRDGWYVVHREDKQ